MSENVNEVSLDLRPLDANTKEIAQRILDEQNVDKVKDLTNLFNLNAQKRNVMRVIKMNELLDKVTDQVITRFENRPDNFSNDDLIKYMQVTENAIDRANKQLNLVDETPPIQFMQNNQVNITVGSDLDSESRQKVFGTVQAILNRMQKPQDDVVEIEVKEEKIEDAVRLNEET